MTDRQITLLKNLAKNLTDLSEECVNDEDFNIMIADLGIFNMSIDEASNEIFDITE